MLFQNKRSVTNGLKKQGKQILIFGRGIVACLKKCYHISETSGLSRDHFLNHVRQVSNPFLTVDFAADVIFSINILSAIYGIREIYLAELLEKYSIQNETKKSLTLERRCEDDL